MKSLNLSCFEDEIYLCACLKHTKDRLSVCMRSSEELINKCSDDSRCRFNGQCFHYDVQSSYYYGTQCQFTTSGFSLSIDSILGYHIEIQTKKFDVNNCLFYFWFDG